jgi:hypothetical protein
VDKCTCCRYVAVRMSVGTTSRPHSRRSALASAVAVNSLNDVSGPISRREETIWRREDFRERGRRPGERYQSAIWKVP